MKKILMSMLAIGVLFVVSTTSVKAIETWGCPNQYCLNDGTCLEEQCPYNERDLTCPNQYCLNDGTCMEEQCPYNERNLTCPNQYCLNDGTCMEEQCPYNERNLTCPNQYCLNDGTCNDINCPFNTREDAEFNQPQSENKSTITQRGCHRRGQFSQSNRGTRNGRGHCRR